MLDGVDRPDRLVALNGRVESRDDLGTSYPDFATTGSAGPRASTISSPTRWRR
jgi:hypothetical protein